MKNQKNILAGVVISLLIATIVYIPRPSSTGFLPSWQSALAAFLHALCTWFFSSWLIYKKRNINVFVKIFIVVFFSFFITIPAFLAIIEWPELKILYTTKEYLPQTVSAFLIVRSVLVSGFTFFVNYLLFVYDEASQLKQDTERIKKEQLEAKLTVLQQKIDPHFLFNALNTLSSIASDKETKNYVLQFSNVYRYILNAHNQPLVKLKAELDFTQAYLYILKERFENGLHIDINVDQKFYNHSIPPVSIQILAENAVKHNIVSPDLPLTIKIFTDEQKGNIIVENNIQPKISVENSTRLGLENLQKRYETICGLSIEICRDEHTFSVSLPLLKDYLC